VTNPVLTAYLDERATCVSTMDQILEAVDGRDLSEAEAGILERSKERITRLDAMIKPLQEFESLRANHAASLAGMAAGAAERVPAQPRKADGADAGPEYRSVGAYLVDLVRSRGLMGGEPDSGAGARVAAYQSRVVANQTTTNTPGILPTPIVGQVVDLIDARRPLITSLGGTRPLGGIPGTTFTRPKITQHTTVGAQAGEKTQLSSQNMVIGSVSFTKATYGGTVDISRQDMDWTEPSAWDILVRDLASVYSIQVETAVATNFATNATGTKPPALPAVPVLADWSKGLYTAAMHSYSAGQRMPTRVWCSLDVWAALGSLVDTNRVVLPVDTTREMGAPGTSELASFAGDLFGLPRIVCPLLPSKTCIVGPDDLYEVYEEMVGLLSVIEPSILGVQVAYGGYVAFNTLAGGAYVPLDLSAVTSLPTSAEFDISAPAAEEHTTPENHGKAKQ
jgi:HK97 family phage major capsid protein